MAGCSHFGFWYRLSGEARCAPLGEFRNNTVHSSGRYGLWIFPNYSPRLSGKCSDRRPGLAQFTHFTSYSCDKAMESLHTTNIQFKNFITWDHHTFGMETLKIDWINSNYYNINSGPKVADSVLIGNSNNNAKSSSPGLVIAQDRGNIISNVSFYNFQGRHPAIQSTDFAGIMPCP